MKQLRKIENKYLTAYFTQSENIASVVSYSVTNKIRSLLGPAKSPDVGKLQNLKSGPVYTVPKKRSYFRSFWI